MSSLYLDHFGLQKPPFKITPDPDFFFTGGRRGDVLSALEHVAGTEEGIIIVVAEVGSGKTLLARLLLERLGSEICTVYLSNPVFSRDEILSAIARDLGIADAGNSTESKLSVLQSELLRRHSAGQRVLLVVDEAHAMPAESLEEIRLLSNLETAHHKLLNILLFGQPELDTLLAKSELRQVRDRVIHRFELPALPHDEACAYVDHRLRAAGWKGGALFAPAALAELVKSSGGRARRINLLADKALLAAYAQGAEQVGVEQVRAALQEIGGERRDAFAQPAHSVLRTWHFWFFSLGFAVLLAGIGLWAMHVLSRPTRADAAKAYLPTAGVGEQAPAASGVLPPAPVLPTTSAVADVRPSPAAKMQVSVHERSKAAVTSADSVVDGSVIAGLSVEARKELAPFRQQLHHVLQDPMLGGFTIQLASLPRDDNVTRYVKNAAHLVDSAMVFVQPSVYNGREYISVFYGKFDSMAAAQRAVAQLPEALKTNKPVVRTWIKIKEDQLP